MLPVLDSDHLNFSKASDIFKGFFYGTIFLVLTELYYVKRVLIQTHHLYVKSFLSINYKKYHFKKPDCGITYVPVFQF